MERYAGKLKNAYNCTERYEIVTLDLVLFSHWSRCIEYCLDAYRTNCQWKDIKTRHYTITFSVQCFWFYYTTREMALLWNMSFGVSFRPRAAIFPENWSVETFYLSTTRNIINTIRWWTWYNWTTLVHWIIYCAACIFIFNCAVWISSFTKIKKQKYPSVSQDQQTLSVYQKVGTAHLKA